MTTLHHAATPDLVDVARELIREYAAMSHVVGRWVDPEREINALPGRYAPPSGLILIAKDGDEAVGCGCICGFDEPGVCEMKRLYVRPPARGQGVGKLLVRALVDQARHLGYSTMRLDKAAELTAAQALYQRLGFMPIPHYRDGLFPNDLCYQLRLV